MTYGSHFPEGYVKTDQWYNVSFQICPERDGKHSGDFEAMDRLEMTKAFAQYVAAKMAASVKADPHKFFKKVVVKNLKIEEDEFLTDDVLRQWIDSIEEE